ncbi:MAG: peptide deformylase [Opitutae bacterium]|jgi:peptide deformylase|nr:peptide deformylase [Opitutae bacterium]HAD22443.1 peptide deformylase [Opitutae bacterium]|tara:strand:+ start:348 stop:956 length:609 start_codon:yes stop_codon:yes gene_type:complete
MTLRITQYGESVLHQKGETVQSFDNELTQLSKDMLEAMHQVQGIGLAAQQVGKAIRFCVMDVPDHPDYPMACILDGKPLSPSLIMPLSLANPDVSALPSDEYYYEEGCLSFPEIRGDVARPERILVRYQDLDGVDHELECDGLLARCIQHEADHLDGILFVERMEREVYAEIKADVKALKKATLDCLREGKLPEVPIPQAEE